MSDQVLGLDKPDRHYQGKYKYLADFSKQQLSPNLRVHYNDSFSKRSNSYERRSPNHSQERRSSFKKSQERHDISNHHYSPSCSTFNPRRETTQQEFSPYDERVEKEQERLNKELLQENAQLRSELIKAGQTIDCLRVQLTKKQTQIIKIKQIHQADLRYFEKVVGQMTNQIQIVLTKNKMLQNELAAVKTQLQQEYIRQQEMHRYQQQRRRHEEFRRREDFRRQDDLRRFEDGRRYEDQRRNTPQPISKRSVGKLMNRPLNSQQQSLGTSKIKIQEDSEYINQSNIQTFKHNQHKGNVDKQARKSEQLIGSIKSMQYKITGEQATSLRELWKWLKGIGHSHSCLKKWKIKASQTSSIYPAQKLKDLIRQACGYIQ